MGLKPARQETKRLRTGPGELEGRVPRPVAYRQGGEGIGNDVVFALDMGWQSPGSPEESAPDVILFEMKLLFLHVQDMAAHEKVEKKGAAQHHQRQPAKKDPGVFLLQSPAHTTSL